jgi:hypothetical protein
MTESHIDQRRYAAVCGACCLSCAPAVAGQCRGCAYELGRTPHGECAIFQCALVIHGVEHCGLCAEFPCALYHSLIDVVELPRRIAALERRRDIGTDAWIEEHLHDCRG